VSKKIIFTSGGTGGHIFPAINLMKYFSSKGYDVLLITDLKGNNFLKNYKEARSLVIKTDTTTNKNIFRKIFPLIKIFFSLINSIVILFKEKPDLIIGFGGYVSFPISFSSIFLKIPLVIYENNLVLGRANKKLINISKKILLASQLPENFPKKYLEKAYKVGSILDKKILDYSEKKEKNKNIFSILVLGGSQGAEIFGKVIPSVVEKLNNNEIKIKINQQCLEYQKKSIIDFYKEKKISYNVFSFTDNILNLISETDLAVSRCGASTTSELVQTLTPFIAVPYPFSTDNHQYLNAKYYESLGCCWMLEQNNFDTNNLYNLILEIIKDEKKLDSIKKNMKANSSKNVFNKIENVIKEFI